MFSKGRHLFKRKFVRLQGWIMLGSVGITPRLVVAFASVAALAAAANLIVLNGALLIEHQQHAAMEQSAIASQAISSLRESRERARILAASAELAEALGQFDRAVQEHVQSDSRVSASRQASARAALDRLLDRHPGGTAAPEQSLRGLVAAHQRSADQWVQLTQARRSLLARYSAQLTNLDARVAMSIDRAWKILGRVVAPRPLLDLRRQLQEIRTVLAGWRIADTGDAAGVSLDMTEQTLADTLRHNEAALRRSQGADWYRETSHELALLAATRVSLSHNGSQRIAALGEFSRESKKLLALLPVHLAEARAAPEQAETQAAARQAAETPSRELVAWLSAAVLIVLLYLSFVTIFSIVRPVRRLIAATNRLARGDSARVVANGGIRELDTLALAFNSMSEQLSVARAAMRDAQQRLEDKVAERTRQLQELAEQDPLTGIANRRQLFDALNLALERACASSERIGLLFLDVDNFKTLNDSMGHPFGDRVLVAIARRLEAIAQRCGFAARLGGDEFTVVCQGATRMDDVLRIGTSIVRAFDSPLQVDDREVIVSVSVGASVFPDHEQDAEALLRAADAALFRAKALGRSQLAVFTPEMLATASTKFSIEQGLRRAIQQQEFELFYQPLVNLQTLDVALVEALIRWRMPDGSLCAPDEFLAVAEESGLIIEIGDWVLRTAIRTAAEWHRGAWPEARVAINVSPRQFLDYRFVGRLEELLREFELPARCVELELTESALQTGPLTIKTLDQLRSIGVAIALDDFGTGYSSLASLHQLPLTRVKLDRSLIAGIDDSARSGSIARATIGLCRSLGLEVTAEGVERIEQFAMLQPHRAMTLQGYLFARPVSVHELLPTLKSLPEQCRELERRSQRLPARVPAARTTSRRTGGLALVAD